MHRLIYREAQRPQVNELERAVFYVLAEVEAERNGPLHEFVGKQQLREMNDALLVSSVRQHEMTEQAQVAEAVMRESQANYRTLFTWFPWPSTPVMPRV